MAISDFLKPTKNEVRGDKVQLLLDHLKANEPEEYEALAGAIRDDHSYSNSDVARALQAEGHMINDGQVRHYRDKLRREMVTL